MTINEESIPKSGRILIVFVAIIVSLGFLFAWLSNDTMYNVLNSKPWNEPLAIQSITWDESSGKIMVIVENTSNETINLKAVYVNETLDAGATLASRVLSKGQVTEIVLSEKFITSPMRIQVRIVSSDEIDAITTKIFYGISLKEVDWDKTTGKISVVVKNYGDETVTISGIYVNGHLDVSAIPNPKMLQSNEETMVNLSGTFMDTHVDIPIKVVTSEGATDEISKPIHGLWIQSINWNSNTGKITAYVYNNGYEDVTNVTYVYVNDTQDPSATIQTHPTGNMWTIILSKTYAENPSQLKLEVTTSDGVFAELNMEPPNEF